jgi:magnesium transporter
MTPEFISVRASMTAEQVLDFLREATPDAETIYYLYVVDRANRLKGVISLRDLIVCPPKVKVEEIMHPDVVSVRTDTDQEEVARTMADYDFSVLPVVDGAGTLVGIVTVDDVLDVVEEEATEDLYRLANLDTQESLATAAPRSVRLRLPWLLVNLATAFLAAWVESLFQETIARYVMLAVFMPIVAGMGGNAGTQSLTVMVRGLALGEMDLRQASTVIGRQALVGLLTGLATGALLALVAWVWERNLVLAGILLFAQTVNLFVAGLFGSAVPLVLRRLDLDPALGSSIFVTTATDCCGFFAFLGTATLLVEQLMPAA